MLVTEAELFGTAGLHAHREELSVAAYLPDRPASRFPPGSVDFDWIWREAEQLDGGNTPSESRKRCALCRHDWHLNKCKALRIAHGVVASVCTCPD